MYRVMMDDKTVTAEDTQCAAIHEARRVYATEVAHGFTHVVVVVLDDATGEVVATIGGQS
ncbi:class d beta-lactamase oxA-58 [Bacteriophage sp.]|nr:class d beta-lactamase oxA-58 [Bacteriophage sp.]